MGLFNNTTDDDKKVQLNEVTVSGISKEEAYQRKMYADSLSLYNKSINIADQSALALADGYRKQRTNNPNWPDYDKVADQKHKEHYEFYKEALVDPLKTGVNPEYGGIHNIDESLNRLGFENLNEFKNDMIEFHENRLGRADSTGRIVSGMSQNQDLTEQRHLELAKSLDFSGDIQPTGVLFNAELPPQFRYQKPTGAGIPKRNIKSMDKKDISLANQTSENVIQGRNINRPYIEPLRYRKTHSKENGWGYEEVRVDDKGTIIETNPISKEQWMKINKPNYGKR